MATRSYILATAGHVDHGKSSLVKALTGTDPDRLPEEKARGITIDLGFASLKLKAGDGDLHVGIVDVPGHEDFVKNMVAGVGAIDAALLVVAADDGWMPQTEEHLQILAYLGVKSGVVALTKIDLPGVSEAESIERIRLKLAGSPLATAPIVGTSTVSGAGLDALKAALVDMFAGVPQARDVGKPRLPIDRVFTLHGIGTVVTGSLIGGTLKRGQPIIIQPSGKQSRIRSLQSFNADVEASLPGMRTAVNLPDISAGMGDGADVGVQRGNVITSVELKDASKAIDVLLERSARSFDAKAARPLKNGTLIRVHHGASNVAARVQLLGSAALDAGDSCLARLSLQEPFFVVTGDRFVVRDWSEQNTLAGGVVLDTDLSARPLKDPAQREFLEQRSKTPADVQAFARTQVLRDRAVRRGELLLKSQFSAADIEAAVAELVRAGKVEWAGEWVVAKGWWDGLQDEAGKLVAAEHTAHPELAGLSLNALRQQIEVPFPELFDVLVAALCARGFVKAGALIRDGKHQPALPPHLQAAGQKLRLTLSAKPLDPPSRKELAPDDLARQALRFFIQTEQAAELGADVVLLSEHFRAATETVRQFLRKHGSATVSDLRQALGTSRRIVVPLLERLDKEGVTIRQGDRRVLRH